MKTAWRFFWTAVLLGCVPAFASDAAMLREWKNRNTGGALDWYRKNDRKLRDVQMALSNFYQFEEALLSKINAGDQLPRLQSFLTDEYYHRQNALAQEGKILAKEFNRRMARVEQVVNETLAERNIPNLQNKLTSIDSSESSFRGNAERELANLRAREESRQRGSFVTFDAFSEPDLEKLPQLTVWKNKKVYFKYYVMDREIAPHEREWSTMQSAVGKLLNGVPDDNLTFENPTEVGDQGLRFRNQKFKIQFLGVNYVQPPAYPGGFPPAPVPSYYVLEDAKELEQRLITLSKFTLRRQRLMKLLEVK